MKHVTVRFNKHGQHYTYRTEEVFSPDDYVVVCNNNIMSVARVVRMEHKYEEKSGITYNWTVQKVDDTRYRELRAIDNMDTPTAGARL